MEIRAAKMKVELAQYLDQFGETEPMPDWENPLVRKTIMTEVSSLLQVGNTIPGLNNFFFLINKRKSDPSAMVILYDHLQSFDYVSRGK